jgi:signal transduction histidine kinase
VRETIESMGGRAWAEFDGGEGSRFLIALPCRRSEDSGRAIRNGA